MLLLYYYYIIYSGWPNFYHKKIDKNIILYRQKKEDELL